MRQAGVGGRLLAAGVDAVVEGGGGLTDGDDAGRRRASGPRFPGRPSVLCGAAVPSVGRTSGAGCEPVASWVTMGRLACPSVWCARCRRRRAQEAALLSEVEAFEMSLGEEEAADADAGAGEALSRVVEGQLVARPMGLTRPRGDDVHVGPSAQAQQLRGAGDGAQADPDLSRLDDLLEALEADDDVDGGRLAGDNKASSKSAALEAMEAALEAQRQQMVELQVGVGGWGWGRGDSRLQEL